MGGCGVRGIFSVYVRRLLLNIMPCGHFSLQAEFFFKNDSGRMLSDMQASGSGNWDGLKKQELHTILKEGVVKNWKVLCLD
jgi:hypothetical protein